MQTVAVQYSNGQTGTEFRFADNGAAPVHNLINWRVACCEGGFMHYGKAGQGVRIFTPRLDLTSHGPGTEYDHRIFGLSNSTAILDKAMDRICAGN